MALAHGEEGHKAGDYTKNNHASDGTASNGAHIGFLGRSCVA
jgi:hypothetical protein